jgi:D-xylose transport system permease protein
MSTSIPHNLPPQNPGGGPNPQGQDIDLRQPGLSPAESENALSLRTLAMPLALLVICIFFAIQAPGFLGSRNLSQLAIEVSITAVLALGMFLVILPGHIDLSAGSSVGLFGGLAAVLVFNLGWPAPIALLAALAAAVLVYFGMGTLIIKERVPAFIITLGGLLMFRGVHQIVIGNSTIPVVQGGQTNLYSHLTTFYLPPTVGWILAAVVIGLMSLAAYRGYARRKAVAADVDGEMLFMQTFLAAQMIALFVLICNGYQGVPLPAVILGVVTVVVYVMTTHSPFGRYLYAIGGNEEAALVSGIPVDRVAIGSFILMGIIAALAGFMQTAYQGSSTPNVGVQMELDAVAACVIGGTSLKGGRGSVAGVLLGALIMAVLLNGMQLMAVGSSEKLIARGVVLALAVWADVRLSRRA